MYVGAHPVQECIDMIFQVGHILSAEHKSASEREKIPSSGRHGWMAAETLPEWGHIPSLGVVMVASEREKIPSSGRMLDGCIYKM